MLTSTDNVAMLAHSKSRDPGVEQPDNSALQCKERLVDCFEGNVSLAKNSMGKQNCTDGQKLCPSLGCIDLKVHNDVNDLPRLFLDHI